MVAGAAAATDIPQRLGWGLLLLLGLTGPAATLAGYIEVRAALSGGGRGGGDPRGRGGGAAAPPPPSRFGGGGLGAGAHPWHDPCTKLARLGPSAPLASPCLAWRAMNQRRLCGRIACAAGLEAQSQAAAPVGLL